jgi:hypothetical protein
MKFWESLSVEEISQPAGLAGLPFERTGVHQVRQDRPPMTMLIPQYGILQIREMLVDSKGCGAIIDYKQVSRKANQPVESASEEEHGRNLPALVNNPEADQVSTVKFPTEVQTRLQADKAVWKAHEKPALTLEIRNVSGVPLRIPATQEYGALEVNGKFYKWNTKVRARIPVFDPEQVARVPVTLSSERLF